jgi:hypothetical protein
MAGNSVQICQWAFAGFVVTVPVVSRDLGLSFAVGLPIGLADLAERSAGLGQPAVSVLEEG